VLNGECCAKPRVNDMTAHNDALNAYKPLFANWQAKVVGSKPTAEVLAKVHGLGLRPGKQAIACAMALRDEGVTGPQIVMVCGAPQLNRMRGLISGGLFKRVVVPANEQGHTVYKCSVTPKGEAEIKRIAKVLANASTSTEVPKAAVKAPRKQAAKPATGKVMTPVAKPADDPLMLPEALRRKPEAQQHA
jgi:hypothetical protein